MYKLPLVYLGYCFVVVLTILAGLYAGELGFDQHDSKIEMIAKAKSFTTRSVNLS